MPRGEDQAAAKQNIRAWVIGRNMAAMRAGDILRGVDLLAGRVDVDTASLRAVARNVPGVWLLMAAAIDPRIGKIWIDQTPSPCGPPWRSLSPVTCTMR